MIRWWHKFSKTQKVKTSKQSKRNTGFRPVLELLEDRVTPSTSALSIQPDGFNLPPGTSTVNGTVATFTDPSPGPTQSYAATVDWGDGTTPSTGTVTLSGSTYSVAANHTYGSNGTYTITTSISHLGNVTQANSVAVVGSDYQHVLIISVDGLREADLTDPALAPYLSNIQALQASGTTYTDASTSSPSDSFPGTLSYLTGAGPGTTGVFYDDSYSRTDLPPALVGGTTPGTAVNYDQTIDQNPNNLSGTDSPDVGYGPSAIDPGLLPLSSVVAVTNETDAAATTTSTTTTYQLQNSPIENDGQVTGSVNGATFTTSAVPGLSSDVVDLNVTANGTTLTSGTLDLSTGLLTLTWTDAPQDSQINVSYNYGIPVYPHNDVGVNTTLGVVSSAGLPTAWIDKHPSYDVVAGPNGQLQQTTVDDLFTPEVNSTVAIDSAHPAHPLVPGSDIMTQLVDSSYNPNNIPLPSGDVTSAVSTSAAYDNIQLQALINEINGLNSLGTVTNNYSPSLFGMNFTAFNNAETIPTDPDGSPGGITIDPTTGQETVSSNIQDALTATNAELGQVVAALKNNDGNSNLANFNNTLVVLTSKHGQNPRIGAAQNIGDPITPVLANAGIDVAAITEDDVALIWLNPATAASQSAAALAALENYAKTSPYQEVDQILTGPQLAEMGYGNPALNSRTPDFVITLKPGFVYAPSGPGAAIADHGGFTADDTQVPLILASGNSALAKDATVTTPVSTTQIAVTSLQALGLNPDQLQGAVIQGTQALPTAAATPVSADLAITSVTSASTPARPGQQETFTITVQNNGPGSVSDLTLINQVTDSNNNAGFTAGTVTMTPSSGTYNAATGSWTVSLQSGDTATLTVTGTVAGTATEVLVDSATVLPGNGVTDPDLSNNAKDDVVSIATRGRGHQPGNRQRRPQRPARPPGTGTFTVCHSGAGAANGGTASDDPAGDPPPRQQRQRSQDPFGWGDGGQSDPIQYQEHQHNGQPAGRRQRDV